jgi:hypothetical protein
MFTGPGTWQKVALGLVMLSAFVLVVAGPVILWLIRQTNIAGDVAGPRADEDDLFAD